MKDKKFKNIFRNKKEPVLVYGCFPPVSERVIEVYGCPGPEANYKNEKESIAEILKFVPKCYKNAVKSALKRIKEEDIYKIRLLFELADEHHKKQYILKNINSVERFAHINTEELKEDLKDSKKSVIDLTYELIKITNGTDCEEIYDINKTQDIDVVKEEILKFSKILLVDNTQPKLNDFYYVYNLVDVLPKELIIHIYEILKKRV